MPIPIATLLAVASVCAPQDPFAAPLADRLPRTLAEASSWRFVGGVDSPRAERGAFPFGNGHVFAAAGLASPACAVSGIVGPRYGVPAGDGGAFGAVRLELVTADGATVTLPVETVWRATDAGFVVAEDRSDSVAVRATYFAPPDDTRILAAVDVVALGPTPMDGLRLRASMEGDARTDGRWLRAEHRAGSETVRARVALSGAAGDSGALVVGLPPVTLDRPWRGALEIATFGSDVPRGAEPPAADRPAVAEAAVATAEWWSARLADTTRYDTDHARLRDLLRQGRVDVLTQTCADTGAVVPMLGRRVVSVRGHNGPLLAFLRYRMWDDARRILDLWWNATLALGRVPSELTLDELPRSAASEDVDTAFWRGVTVPEGDVASWVVLQHFWYWRATRDTALIEQRWPLIEVCIKKQARREDVLIPFAGDERWVRGIASLPPDLLGDAPELIGHDPEHGRTADSFASSVAFLMAVHAVGDLVDAIDRARNPERWADGAPDPAPSRAYVRRAFGLMAGIEERFWQADLGCFAPARSPVDGSVHRTPVANGNLLPLWIGWTFPTGERSRDNLRNTLHRLWLDDGRIGTTRTLGVATGDLQGLVLVALAERDGRGRLTALDRLLESAAPTGGWSTFHGPDGRPLPDAGAPLDPAVLGVNLDAIVFALTGIRQAAYAGWDDDDIRLELRLPHGASWFTVRGATKDGRTLDVFFREEVGILTEEERRANDELSPERRRDPDVPHRRLKFVVDLVAGSPPKGYYDVAVNAEGTVFVRYLQPNAPESPDDPDLRRIDEMEFVTPDELEFLPARRGEGPAPPPRTVEPAAGARVLALTCRRAAAELLAAPDVTLLDTAMPDAADVLPRLLMADGAPRHRELYLDWHFRAPPPAGWNAARFSGPAFAALLDRYREAGGRVITPGFVESFTVDGEPRAAAADGALALPGGQDTLVCRASIPSERAADVVLRFGANAPFVATLGDRPCIESRNESTAEPDRDAALVHLEPGENIVEIRVEPRRDGAPRVLFVRASGPDGLPPR